MPRPDARRSETTDGGARAPEPGPRVVSVNVGRTREWPWENRIVRTAFLKEPQPGSVEVGPNGLAGDECADRTAHGGPRKTVYAYASEHYPFWLEQLGLPSLPWGSFGENLTTEGISEAELAPGDLLETVGVTLAVVQPRFPCFKLNARFGRADMMSRFLAAGRSGVYFSVVRPGPVRAGDRLEVRRGPTPTPTIGEIYRRRALADGAA